MLELPRYFDGFASGKNGRFVAQWPPFGAERVSVEEIFDVFILSVVPLVIAVVLHEISHGMVAYALGDDTAKRAGRFKLHTHFDLFGSFLIPLFLYMVKSPFLIGYAKPVPVDWRKFANPRMDMALVAVGGPLCNALLALAAIFILRSCEIFSQMWVQFLFNFITVNLALGLFNLIPIPPLDGSRVLTALLPARMAEKMYRLEPYGILLLFGVEFLGSQLSKILGFRVGILVLLEMLLRKIIRMIF
ncbi:MAG: site-2 protease family protein [Holosporaceae bacterium]|nr:site-2 protease family protein [Holosporaceae bacterium]